jgi:putative ABC transport system permease protein
VAVLVLSLGIGANTAIFSMINAMMFQPIASEGAGIVGVYAKSTVRPDDYRAFSWQEYQQIRDGKQVFADVFAFTMTMLGATEGDATRRSFSAIVTRNYFDVFGVRLAAGRTFTEEEERPNSNIKTVIVGYQFARRAGVAPSEVIGRTTRLNGHDFTIVGVTPEGFSGTMALIAPEFWLPIGVYGVVSDEIFRTSGTPKFPDPANRQLMLVGRLREGLSEKTAGASLTLLTQQLRQADSTKDGDHELMVQKLPRLSVSTHPQDDSELTALAVLLMGMSGLVLLVACLNLANMLLARGTVRRKEVAVRLALGSGRGRLIRQLLTESLLLAFMGGVAGLLLALWGTRLLTTTFAAVLPMVVTFDVTPDIRVLTATMGFAVISTVVAGLGPAWRVTRPDVLPDLKEQLADFRAGRRFTMRNLLVVCQVALSLALLTAAGLFMRGAVKASVADPGFPLQGGLIANVDPALAGYDEARGRVAIANILRRVRSTPGIASASLASLVPFGEFQNSEMVQTAGTPPAPEGQKEQGVDATFTVVGADYFETLRLPILRGRSFTPAEESAANTAPAVVVDEPLARKLFAGEDPLGRRVQFAGDEKKPKVEYEVIGVVAGVRHDLFEQAPTPHVYAAFGPNYVGNLTLHARVASGMDERAMLETLRRQIRAADEGVPIMNVKTLEQHRDGSIMLWAVNTGARLFSAFGFVALLLAVIGIYGVKSYVVSRRTREIGIRMALGATRADVLQLVMREGLMLTLAGLALGLVLSYGVAQAVSGMLYQVSALDPLVFAVAPLLLGLASMTASFIPARRATRVVPISALRTD